MNLITPERPVLCARIAPSLEIRQYIFAPELTDHPKIGSFGFEEVSAAAFSVRQSGIFADRLAPGKNERNGARIKAASETVTNSALASFLSSYNIFHRIVKANWKESPCNPSIGGI